MAQCEMCGTEEDHLTLAIIEGVELKVCKSCLKLGKKKPSIPKRFGHKTRIQKPNFEERVISNAGNLIKSAREKRNMRQIDLAKMLQIKDSQLHHIEIGDMPLNLKLAKEIEHTLEITLVKKFKHIEVEETKHETTGLTLGDLIKSKK